MNPGPLAPEKAATHTSHTAIPKQYLAPFVLVTGLFFFWGIPNNLNDVLIRQFMKSFEITRLQAGLIQFAFYLGYFFLSMPAALLMRRFGYKAGLVTGMGLYSVGTFLFWPAALAQSYPFFLIALFVIASGLAFLETGASPFIAQLGDSDNSAWRLNFSQSFNTLGAITGAMVGTVFILSGVELSKSQVADKKAAGTYTAYLHYETLRVITPYLVLGCVVLLWGIIMLRTRFPQLSGEHGNTESAERGRISDLFQHSHFVQAVIAQFFYVGAQVGIWSFYIQYIKDYVSVSEKYAGYMLSGTLVAFALGRFSSTYLMRWVPAAKLMGIYTVVNIFLVTLSILFPGWIGVGAIFLTSFFMSLSFPTIFALGLVGLGANTKVGGSLIVMAIVGGALFPLLMGAVPTMANAMLIPLGCFVFIAYFSFWGSRVKQRA